MSDETYERRFIPFGDSTELRVDEDDDGIKLSGTAPPYGEWSQKIGGRFLERFEPGAFDDTETDIIATQEHNDSLLLGRTSSGTLSIRDDDDGRHYTVTLPDTAAGRDVAALAKRGDLRGSSFEFKVKKDGDRWVEEDGEVRRTIKKKGATMRQIGPVARPAYPQFGLALRSLEAWEEERKEPDEGEKPGPAMSPDLERDLQEMELSATLTGDGA